MCASPSGVSMIAFTGNYDGNDDVYVMPAQGGEPKRLTFDSIPENVVGWTPDGNWTDSKGYFCIHGFALSDERLRAAE